MRVLAGLLALHVLVSPAHADEAASPARLPRDLARAARLEVSAEGLATLAATGALYALARPDDQRVKAAVTGPRPPVGAGLARAGTWAGNAGLLFGAAALTYGAGWAFESARAQDFGLTSVEALTLAGLQVELLKVTARRRRPDGADLASFPSGHSAESFAVAAVAASEFGWAVGVPACAAAAFIGYTRLQNNKHFLSDVVFGAGLGVLSGRAVWRARHARGAGVSVMPYFDGRGAGTTVALAF